jgi:hypothetical protein
MVDAEQYKTRILNPPPVNITLQLGVKLQTSFQLRLNFYLYVLLYMQSTTQQKRITDTFLVVGFEIVTAVVMEIQVLWD